VIARLWRERREAAPGDEGYTLVEMVVVVGILTVVLAAVQGTLIMTNKAVGQNAARLDQSQQARVAIDSMTRNLRTAVLPSQLNCSSCASAAFINGTATSVAFYANINNDANAIGPSQVTYTITAGVLHETIQPPDAHAVGVYNYTWTSCSPGPGCSKIDRVLARGVLTAAPAAALFTYYDKSGAAITTLPLTATDLAKVDSVDVVIQVDSSVSSAINPTTLTQRVTLPNADSVPQPSSSP